MPFYVGDWRKDVGVQSLGYHERGVWFEILCLMFESEQRGKLLLNGIAMPLDALARLLGLDKQVLTKTLTTLLETGVASRDSETGALMSRRMVRDENLRQIRKNCGKLGGNPNLVNQKSTTEDKLKSTPSASSSISVSSSETERKHTGPGLPRNETEAVEWASMTGVTADFAREVYHQCEGVGWIDGAQRPISNWRSYVASRFSKDRKIQKQASPHAGAVTLKIQLDAIDREIVEIKKRGSEDNWSFKPLDKDKDRYRELKAKRRTVNDQLTRLT